MAATRFPTVHAGLRAWVDECIRRCRPARVHWCDGSDEERRALLAQMGADGTLEPLNPARYPGCYLHRSHPDDVARVEQRTFICSRRPEDAGPTNHWMDPEEAKRTLYGLFEGCMQGRTLFVVPYVMGPPNSPFARVGVEITDSAYVALSMRIMTRMGTVALEQLGADGEFVPGLHSVGGLDPARRYICHFPQERLILSYGSGYGGNALLGKKCFALRIASAMARDEGWLAEHMLILELSGPDGETDYFAAAFPSACGKTNLAMLVSPLEAQGWRVRTIGDDIAWIHVGADGRLWAVNPEAGFFGVAPGTSARTNPHAMATIQRDTIFTNVAVSDDGIPWWEGIGEAPPEWLTDWKGNRRRVAEGGEPFAHANARFTAPAKNCPGISPRWEDPQGVPLSAILFGGRRHKTIPLALQARSWRQGVYFGATLASRTTAAAEGQADVLRRDPMAMRPFCGYHMADYFAHWLAIGERVPRPPAIFYVNWFRRDENDAFLWPGFGQNVRVLIWIRERLRGRAAATETFAGFVPTLESLPREGLDLSAERLALLLSVQPEDWRREVGWVDEYFPLYGDRLPAGLRAELEDLRRRLEERG